MDLITNKLMHLKEIHKEKMNSIILTENAYQIFLKFYGHLKFYHIDIRGGDTTPVIILATYDEFIIDRKFQTHIENSKFYNLFKQNLLTFGTISSTRDNKKSTHFYIQSNQDLRQRYPINNSTLKKVLLGRTNNELFPHIDSYLK